LGDRDTSGKREQKSLERRRKVLESALEEFLANGFAATRIEDVAVRAGVAKGTVYLYCKDKEALFAEAVRSEMIPLAHNIHAMLEDGTAPPRQVIERGLGTLLQNLVSSRRGDVVRLILGESLRFPHVTTFYREEIVFPAVQRVKALLNRARDEGSLRAPAIADFPQLAIAPIMMTVLVKGIAPQFAADPDAMLKAYLDTLFNP
jgi:AcrR family transcriptional regulator